MDKQYWDTFYKNHANRDDISECSTFASFCCDNFLEKESKTIVDLGCGNARDAKHFARNHLVYGTDQSIDDQVINTNKLPSLKLMEQDFVYDEYNFSEKVDVFYSRCSAVVAPASRRASSGASCLPASSRTTSWSTATSPSPAPTRIASSWSVTLTS